MKEENEKSLHFFLEYESAIQIIFIIYYVSTLQNMPVVVLYEDSLALSLILTTMSKMNILSLQRLELRLKYV